MEKTINDLGYVIKPAAAEVIILQFRKFMAVMAFNLMSVREEEVNEDFIANFEISGNSCKI